jgi:hypothetical protein
MGLGRMKIVQSLTWICTNQTTSWALLVLGRGTCKIGFTRLIMAQTWGKPPPSPYNILYTSPHGHIQMTFYPGTPKWESRNSQNCVFFNFGAP